MSVVLFVSIKLDYIKHARGTSLKGILLVIMQLCSGNVNNGIIVLTLNFTWCIYNTVRIIILPYVAGY